MHDLLARRWKFLALRCENVPAFWAVYALILVETIGEGVLAIPIAVAKIGPLAGVGILIVIGVVNTLTILSLAEASARNGSVRYGVAYLGRVVQDYLGRTWAFVVVIAVTVIQVLALVSDYVGFSTTMAEATHLPAAVWAGAIFLVCFYFLRKGSFASATGVVFLIGGLNVATILALLVMTIPHVDLEKVLYTEFSLGGAKAFDPSWLQLGLGVIFSAYLGHLGVVNSAQFALRRDSSARSLVWGSIAAQVSLIIIYSLWVVAVNGTIDPSVLAAQSGTALVPLASQLGPLIYVLGSALIFLGIGVGSIVTALGFLPGQRMAAEDFSGDDLASTRREASSRERPLSPALAILVGRHSGHRHFWLRGMAPCDGKAVVYESLELSWSSGRSAHCRSISSSSPCRQPGEG